MVLIWVFTYASSQVTAWVRFAYRFIHSDIGIWAERNMGFPVALVVKNSLQCRRCWFDPWVGRIPWRRAWQPISVLFPGESHGQRSLAGYSPQNRKELDTSEATEHAHNWNIWETARASLFISICLTLNFSLPGGLRIKTFYQYMVVIITQRDNSKRSNRGCKDSNDLALKVT